MDSGRTETENGNPTGNMLSLEKQEDPHTAPPMFKKRIRSASLSPVVIQHWEVTIYVTVAAVHAVDTQMQTFDCEFFVRAMWVEPGASEKLERGEELFDPRILIKNRVGELERNNESTRVCPWREGPNGEDVVEHRCDYVGTLRDRFELQAFPFDTQFLTVTITSNYPHPDWPVPALEGTTVSFVIDPKHNRSSKGIVGNMRSQPEFQIDIDPVLALSTHTGAKDPDAGKVAKKELKSAHDSGDEALIAAAEAAYDALPKQPRKFATVYADLSALRRYDYYLWNVMVPQFLITMLGVTVYGIPIDDVADRMSVTLALVLTAVAFKFTVTENLPQVSYLTYLDYFTLMNMLFLVVLGLENLIASKWSSDKDEIEEFDEHALFYILCLYVGTMACFGIIGVTLHKLRSSAANAREGIDHTDD